MAKATAKKPEDRFPDAGRAIVSLPGIGDVTRFGLSSDEEPDEQSLIDAEELRLQRELEREAVEKARSLKAKRGITGLLAGVFLACYLVSSIYALLYPKLWVEYKHASHPTPLDSFQLGVGLWSGKAWGVTPKIYDPFKKGGQDVPGEWTLKDGHFQLRFRKFKLVGPNDNGKKRWQSMGTDSTSAEDYFIWTDFLSYDRDSDALMFVKRIGNKGETYIPVADRMGTSALCLRVGWEILPTVSKKLNCVSIRRNAENRTGLCFLDLAFSRPVYFTVLSEYLFWVGLRNLIRHKHKPRPVLVRNDFFL